MAAFKPRVLYQHQLKKRRPPGKRPGAPRRPDLSLEQILGWIDAFHARTGRWPHARSGPIPDSAETWRTVDYCLYSGSRAPFGGSSLARLLRDQRGVRNVLNRHDRPPFTIQRILAWADEHRKRTARWPTQNSGPIQEAPGEFWRIVADHLRKGGRGLPGGTSLARLLAERRGARNRFSLPQLSPVQILVWAKSHHEKMGKWPTRAAGPVGAAPMESWLLVDAALRLGARGLPGGSSLAQFLECMLGVRNQGTLPPLSVAGILRWADAHFQRTGSWPLSHSGTIVGAPNETWCGVDTALTRGKRGLKKGGSSLARFLEKHRGVRNTGHLPALKIKKILEWADEHHERTGVWPTDSSGAILAAPGETWQAIEAALYNGRRGLPGGSSLARVLQAWRGRRNLGALAPITEEMILQWADAYRERTGKWPSYASGLIAEGRTEKWSTVNGCLRVGGRGLPGGSSLALLLAKRRGARNRTTLPDFRIGKILTWAKHHFRQTGKWPTQKSGAILSAPEDTWRAVEMALIQGSRGLPGNSSLAQLLDDHLETRKKTRRQETRLAKKNRRDDEMETRLIKVVEPAEGHG